MILNINIENNGRRKCKLEYLIQERLDNKVHDISYDQLKILYRDNLKEERESKRITESSYRGESFFSRGGNTYGNMEQESLLRDPKTSGFRMYYPHGIVINQSERRNYYRGENQIYTSSEPSLLRKLKRYSTVKEQELYRLVADMRIAEFKFLLQKFKHVNEWKYSDILYEPLAQHYGLDTCWLDITSDFNTALFFATCYWDGKQWLPLTKKQTEIGEDHQYGMIFHMPSNRMVHRWSSAIEIMYPWTESPIGKDEKGNAKYGKLEYPLYRGELNNIIYPIGFQPFMRCHMQNGYGIYMRNSQPLQNDFEFEKLRFRHSEKLSNKVYDIMNGGELIYPHEGLKEAQYLIDKIKNEFRFSVEAFNYALYRSHYYRIADADIALHDLYDFRLDGNRIEIIDSHPWKISSGRRQKIDEMYKDFSIESKYGILVIDRKQIPEPSPLYEPWMVPDKNDGEGIKDFKVRDSVDCGSSIVSRNLLSDLYTLMHRRLSDF